MSLTGKLVLCGTKLFYINGNIENDDNDFVVGYEIEKTNEEVSSYLESINMCNSDKAAIRKISSYAMKLITSDSLRHLYSLEYNNKMIQLKPISCSFIDNGQCISCKIPGTMMYSSIDEYIKEAIMNYTKYGITSGSFSKSQILEVYTDNNSTDPNNSNNSNKRKNEFGVDNDCVKRHHLTYWRGNSCC